MIIRIPIPWVKPNIPDLHATIPTSEKPITIDDLIVFPENLILFNTPFTYDSVRELYWFRTYTDVRGMSLGSEESITLSFKTMDGKVFKKNYRPMFFTEARRKVPNALWSAFCYISEHSYPARFDFYMNQIQKFNRWTINGTTFDLSGLVIKDDQTVKIANAQIFRYHDHMSFTEVVPYNGLFRKTKKITIEANHITDYDCFYVLLKHFFKIL